MKTICAHCDRHFEIDDNLFGSVIVCPHCSKQFIAISKCTSSPSGRDDCSVTAHNSDAKLADAHTTLGVSPGASSNEIQTAYEKLMEALNEECAKINQSYEMIMAARSARDPINTENNAEDGTISVRCPSCRASFNVSEDSEEYIVECPHCHASVDLTEIE